MNTFIQWNINGLFSKLPYLQEIISKFSPLIIALQETKLNHQNLALKNYKIYRKDRNNNGGGVLLAIHNKIPSQEIYINSNIEIISCLVYFKNKNINISSIYIPSDVECSINDLESIFNQVEEEKVILGDFNAKHSIWGSNLNDNRGCNIAEFILENNLDVINTGSPTFCRINDNYYSHIDVSLVSLSISQDFNWETYDSLLESDHFPIVIKYKCENLYEQTIRRWITGKADWKLYREKAEIPEINEEMIIDNIKILGKEVTKSIIKAAEIAIPKTKGVVNIKYNNLWWNKECENATNKKKHSLNIYRRNPNTSNLIQYKKDKAKARKVIRESKRKSWMEYVSTINSFTKVSEVWRVINSLDRKIKSIPKIILVENNEKICDPEILANKFVKYYSDIGDEDNYDENFLLHKMEMEFQEINFESDNTESYNSKFTLRELSKAIQLSKASSPGEDEIHYDFIKQLPIEQLINLLKYYNILYTYDQINDDWNEIVVPILKPNKNPHNISSYRPIALTSCLSKIMERMVNERLTKYLEVHNSISTYQSGFRKCHSTYDALIRLETNIRETFIRNEFLIVVSLDIEKAYDMVWHYGLLRKVRNLEIKGHMGFYIKNFLQNRVRKVRIGGKISKAYKVKNGTPQGSVISPTLFSIMINNLFEKCEYVEFALFADDGLMMIRTNNLEEGIEKMQRDIEIIEEWSETQGLRFSVEKTKSIIFTKRPIQNPTNLTMNGKIIQYVDNIRYLGVIFDKTLTWKSHIENLKAACMKKLILLKSVSKKSWGADRKTLKMLYISLIQSKLNYASFVYDTAADCHLKKLDRIQYEGIRICTGALRCTRTDFLEAEANIMPLKYQRKLIGLNYFVRAISISKHSSRQLFNEYYTFQFYLIRPHPLPFIAYVKDTLNRLGITIDKMECIKMGDLFIDNDTEIRFNMKLEYNKQENPIGYRAHFQEMFEELYEDYLDVFTDGSKKEERVGYGIWASNNFEESGRITNKCGIFTAELYAILRALRFISHNEIYAKFVIFCDSYGALKSIQKIKSRNSLVIRIKKELQNIKEKDKEVILEWIPSHVGIKGNEMADDKAKKALDRNTYRKVKYSYEDIKSMIKQDISKQWQEEWNEFDSYLHRIKPNLEDCKSSYSRNRREEVVISRLRMGCTLLDVKHHFEKIPPPQCDTCRVRLTVKHIIMYCPKYVNKRNDISKHIRENNLDYSLETVLKDSFPIELVLLFLYRCGLMDSL